VVGAQVAGLAVTFVLHLIAVGLIVPLHPVVDTRYWRALLSGAFLLGLAIALSQIYFRVDAVILSLLRSAAEVGFYGAAYKFIELSGIVNAAVGISMFPALTRFIAVQDARAAQLVQTVFDLLMATAAPLAIVMFAFAEEIVVFAAGPEFAPGGDALRLLAPYVFFSFANGVLWRTLISSSRDRALLASSVFVLVLNVVLNLALIPEYGFKAAAVIAVASEAAVTVPLAFTARQEGLLPTLGYAPKVLAASGAMIGAILVLPGPWAFVAIVAGGAYSVVLLLLPGTARRVVFGELLPALRR
jgi:O-antigen/teichoic acid export membrane protein